MTIKNVLVALILLLPSFILLVMGRADALSYERELNATKVFQKKTKPLLDSYKDAWRLHAQRSEDPSRSKRLLKLLTTAAGVYSNKAKAKELSLAKTVLINVVSYNHSSNSQYKSFLFNWLCFVTHYDIQPILFLLGADVESSASILKSLAPQVLVFSYPDELFWKLVGQKDHFSDWTRRGHVDFNDTEPSFSHFGALVMLVPTLEILELGFNVIFFDIDNALVHDPIPYISRGTADFVMSPEIRHCFYPSQPSRRISTNFHEHEPNTGIMMVRSTASSILLYRKWLRKLIDRNAANDQYDLDFRHMKADYVGDCFVKSNAVGVMLGDSIGNITTNDRPTFCYLSELMFQNGMTAMKCGEGKSHQKVDYLLNMEHFGFANVLTEEATGLPRTYYTPVTMHPNYCLSKLNALSHRGLWLVTENATNSAGFSCRAYNVKETSFAKMDWGPALDSAQSDLQRSIAVVPEHTPVRFPRMYERFILEDGFIRLVPNAETLQILGFEWDDAKMLWDPLHRSIPQGDDYPNLDAEIGALLSSSTNLDLMKDLMTTTKALAVTASAESLDMLIIGWRKLAKVTFDPSRDATVRAALQQAAGVYSDASNVAALHLQRTVLVTMVTLKAQAHSRYREYLLNWLCYCAHYGYKPVIYLGYTAGQNITAETALIRRFAPAAQVLGYPVSLFWAAIANKTLQGENPLSSVDFLGETPRATHFGAPLQLVPLLELMQHGYDVIYMDTSVALVQDPMPHLAAAAATADFVSAAVSHSCIYSRASAAPAGATRAVAVTATASTSNPAAAETPSTAAGEGKVSGAAGAGAGVGAGAVDGVDYHSQALNGMNKLRWFDLQADPSIMVLRSTDAGQQMLATWLRRTIDSRAQLLTQHLNFKRLGLRPSPSCGGRTVTAAADHSTSSSSSSNASSSSSSQSSASSSSGFIPAASINRGEEQGYGSYCFLPDLLFQSSKMAMHCAEGKGGAKGDYVLALHGAIQSGTTAAASTSPTAPAAASATAAEATSGRNVAKGAAGAAAVGVTPAGASTLNLGHTGRPGPGLLPAPVTVYLKYVLNRIEALKSRGLWLVVNATSKTYFPDVDLTELAGAEDASSDGAGAGAGALTIYSRLACRAYNFMNTSYGTFDWKKAVADALAERAQQMKLANGSLVTYPGSRQVHLLVDGRLRLVPDADTFVSMGFSWGNIKTLHSVVAEGYTQGPPLPQRRPS